MIIIAFSSTHDALEVEEALIDNNIKLRTIPTPREITAGCGISLKLDEEFLQCVKQILIEHDIINRQIFYETIEEGRKEYKLIE
ncbi:MAG: DUF3343 domain-containing protein [Clostridia bacterium]